MKLSLLTFLHYQGFTKDLCGAFEHYIYHLHGEICCRFFEISLHNKETLRVFRARTLKFRPRYEIMQVKSYISVVYKGDCE